MSRYTGPKFKLSRRLGISLSGTGKELKTRIPSRSTRSRPTQKNERLWYSIARKTKASSYVRFERKTIPQPCSIKLPS